MRSLLTAIAIILSVSVLSASSIIYVKENGTGDGSSWNRATGDLQAALTAATKGDEVWVAEGIYVPVLCTSCNDRLRGISFKIKNGVALYGGFKGDEKKRSQRKWKDHPTTLSGNIGSNSMTDNSFSVVYMRNVSDETILDGFIIADGNADGMAIERDMIRAGAGVYNDGENGSSNPTIRNCIFMYNYASEGGAIFNNGKNGAANPKISNCIFVNNTATQTGGAIANFGKKGKSLGTFENCKFVSNKARLGGAVFALAPPHIMDTRLKYCTFLNNKATIGPDYHAESHDGASANSRTLLQNDQGSKM